MRSLVVVLLCLTGCFVQLGASYAPGAKIGIQRATDPTATTHTESAATINVRLGMNIDIGGVGAYWGFYAPRVTQREWIPVNFAARQRASRFDADIPVRFGPNRMFGLRASYAHESIDKAGMYSTEFDAHGSGNSFGLSLTTLSKDISLNVLAGNVAFQTDGAPMQGQGYPEMSFEAFNVDIGVTIRFVPTGTLFTHYVAGDSGPIYTGQKSYTCGWRALTDGGGYVCER